MTGPLRRPLADYLTLRRSLGFKLARHEKLLGQFLTHLEDAGITVVTVAAAVDWAVLPAGGDGYWWGYRLSAVRGFARYLNALDPRHEVPPVDLLPQRPHRAVPYLYSSSEVAAHRRRGHAAQPGAPSHVRDADRAAAGHRDACR